MSYRSRRADLLDDDDIEHLIELHRYTFGVDAKMANFDYGAWWLVFPLGSDTPIAFGGIVPSEWGAGYAYLKRSGVLHGHLGHGLQRRLLRIREAYARREGYHTILTDTRFNPQSANNLIKCGYRLWEPQDPWAKSETMYWRKPLRPARPSVQRPTRRSRQKLPRR